MALVIKDRVLETCSSPGSGAVTLLGAVTGYQTFNAAVANGNTCYYTIADQNGNNWEVGLGTFTAPATLTRTTVYASSNGGTTVNFSTGTQNVFLTYPATKAVTTDTLAYPPAIGGTTPNTGDFTTLTANADSSFTSTGAVLISKGTTLQQPGTPVTGMFRYNTTTNAFEGYSGSSPAWNPIAGVTVIDDTSTSSDLYPLFSTALSGNVGTEYVSSTKLKYKPSDGSFQALEIEAGNSLFVSSNNITQPYTLANDVNAVSYGPITISGSGSVEVPAGSNSQWTIVTYPQTPGS